MNFYWILDGFSLSIRLILKACVTFYERLLIHVKQYLTSKIDKIQEPKSRHMGWRPQGLLSDFLLPPVSGVSSKMRAHLVGLGGIFTLVKLGTMLPSKLSKLHFD